MKIATRTVGRCKVLDCSGPLVLGPATAELRNSVREAVKGGTPKVVLNLKDVDYIDSSGIGEMISCFIHAKNQGVKLPLLNLNQKVHTLLVVAKLLVIFDVFDDEKKALEGC
ncbi:MAG: STAS domain-containing protein [Acidobacteria bacterium]|nr:STAS domain-containing protein [Acidobacteriota bacterium]